MNVRVFPKGPVWRCHIDHLQPRYVSTEDTESGTEIDGSSSSGIKVQGLKEFLLMIQVLRRQYSLRHLLDILQGIRILHILRCCDPLAEQGEFLQFVSRLQREAQAK